MKSTKAIAWAVSHWATGESEKLPSLSDLETCASWDGGDPADELFMPKKARCQRLVLPPLAAAAETPRPQHTVKTAKPAPFVPGSAAASQGCQAHRQEAAAVVAGPAKESPAPREGAGGGTRTEKPSPRPQAPEVLRNGSLKGHRGRSSEPPSRSRRLKAVEAKLGVRKSPRA